MQPAQLLNAGSLNNSISAHSRLEIALRFQISKPSASEVQHAIAANGTIAAAPFVPALKTH
jgi:hypothetical protein